MELSKYFCVIKYCILRFTLTKDGVKECIEKVKIIDYPAGIVKSNSNISQSFFTKDCTPQLYEIFPK